MPTRREFLGALVAAPAIACGGGEMGKAGQIQTAAAVGLIDTPESLLLTPPSGEHYIQLREEDGAPVLVDPAGVLTPLAAAALPGDDNWQTSGGAAIDISASGDAAGGIEAWGCFRTPPNNSGQDVYYVMTPNGSVASQNTLIKQLASGSLTFYDVSKLVLFRLPSLGASPFYDVHYWWRMRTTRSGRWRTFESRCEYAYGYSGAPNMTQEGGGLWRSPQVSVDTWSLRAYTADGALWPSVDGTGTAFVAASGQTRHGYRLLGLPAAA
jgi:hypothetical protein